MIFSGLFIFYGEKKKRKAESGEKERGVPSAIRRRRRRRRRRKLPREKKQKKKTLGRFSLTHLSLSLSISTRFQLALRAALSSGADPNEVEATGNTPLHSAAFEGWAEGIEALLKAGAKPLASNNAGDRPWHWAINMGHDDVADIILTAAAGGPQAAEQGLVIVQDHVPKVKEFFSKPCWAHHPKPYKDFIEAKRRSDAAMRAAASAEGAGLLPGL